ncbi:type II toxin-antitoxin system RelB/DinJ family antitoxin [Lactiplantibacillus mudanjiangensis]|uniref:DNA-damage-inducible protein [Lactobacillus casei subsp. casei ATCC 393] n=1 Tax=Lactiplantibacillus mudanjiangensis TaxID=1296538 RepID=A0A660DXR3_9LACO|nr:type II toxin-antitoxin system RelB/DinJ family antitoxin [Lactiplantibacillus mudanjiangensis]VDG19722.1 DNA-damage-inducible protein [Lactobacillus casei subsp. casei ATCC 393] [Lactiplantibacillus mudanjiangensis]VDG24396.1 DNA-damage-inducible protein [Lactobacillus casei subsp. casei ATCC 393] [Lactiplantibacillus mudanjiangensis]VDG28198.1 DNA-damage-inducible protein [Lactobacillus casei subsp. casei ATCC 393] [Lactiplantibacillus mudanjiangensis]VDG31154.1 DNA-damage-inducible protei
MAVQEKKRIQVQVNKELAEDTEQVLNELGLSPTTAITMFYKRIVANGGLPFQPMLTQGEKASLHFLKETEDTPVTQLNTVNDVQKWLDNPDED